MNQTDFKALWQGLPTGPVPPVDEVIGEAKKLLRKTKGKMIATNVALAGTMVFIIWIFINLHVQMLTTKVGVLLLVVGIVSYLMVFNRMLLGLFKPIPEMDSKTYLERMIATNTKQQFLQKKMLTVYFICLSLGLALYMVEYVSKMSWWVGILVYVAAIAWMAFNWFIMRPKMMRKCKAQFDKIIERLERINNATGEEE